MTYIITNLEETIKKRQQKIENCIKTANRIKEAINIEFTQLLTTVQHTKPNADWSEDECRQYILTQIQEICDSFRGEPINNETIDRINFTINFIINNEIKRLVDIGIILPETITDGNHKIEMLIDPIDVNTLQLNLPLPLTDWLFPEGGIKHNNGQI